ncbi:MAG: imidazole glycerol phosphate synthase subunit HisH [Acidobacteriota bacterium]
MIGIIDYHLNNLRSVQKAFEKVGAEAFISDDPAALSKADRLLLPGVGAFGAAMENLRALGLDAFIRERAAAGTPLLGICLGMQLLFTRSEEGGDYEGFDFIRGSIRQFPSTVKVPHIGWNQIDIRREAPLLRDVKDHGFVYFVHSYYAQPEEDVTLCTTDYAFPYASVVQKDRIIGIQFHPEKSQETGLRLLANFAAR